MKTLHTLSLLLLALVAATACGGQKETAATGDDDFVGRDSSGLVLHGQPYRFVGTNFWYGAILASEGQGGDRQRLEAELDTLHALGIDNLRILVGSDGERGVLTKVEPTLQEAPGQYNDTILAGLDYLLLQMGQRGMKAVLYLNNSWEWSGGYGYYLEQAGAGPTPRPNEAGYPAFMNHVAQFSANEEAQRLFFDYVAFIVGRTNRYTQQPYSADPAIMAWQIGNEPRAFSDEMKQPFAQWLAKTSALIRSIDPRHLISIGSEGIWGCEMDEALYEQISADPNIDYLTAHVWPYNWGWAPQDALESAVDSACAKTDAYIARHTDIARRLGKALVIEEFGYPRDGFVFAPGTPTTGRDRYYAHVFGLVGQTAEVAGANFWAWGGLAQPRHEQWLVGDPYTGDPAQEQQGLNSVFAADSSTLQLLRGLKPGQ